MTADALAVLRVLFGSIWRIFTSWYIPGTNTTPAMFFVFLLFAVVVIKFVSFMFGVGSDIAHNNSRGGKKGE